MLQNAYLLAKIGANTAENEQHFAEISPTDALWRHRLPGGAARQPPVNGVVQLREFKSEEGEEAAVKPKTVNWAPDKLWMYCVTTYIYVGLVLGCIDSDLCKQIF